MNGAVYGQSLYLLAKEDGLETEILQQLKLLTECFAAQPDYLKLLSSHNLPKEERTDVLDAAFRGQVHGYVLNFLKLLTEKGYIGHFSDCCKAYVKEYNADHGILEVQVVSAVVLTQPQQEKLTEKLSAMTGKTVALSCKIDPAVLGGVRLQYDGHQVDGTVKNRLETMEKTLRNTVI